MCKLDPLHNHLTAVIPSLILDSPSSANNEVFAARIRASRWSMQRWTAGGASTLEIKAEEMRHQMFVEERPYEIEARN